MLNCAEMRHGLMTALLLMRSETLNCTETRLGLMTALLLLMRSEMLNCTEETWTDDYIVDVNEK